MWHLFANVPPMWRRTQTSAHEKHPVPLHLLSSGGFWITLVEKLGSKGNTKLGQVSQSCPSKSLNQNESEHDWTRTFVPWYSHAFTTCSSFRWKDIFVQGHPKVNLWQFRCLRWKTSNWKHINRQYCNSSENDSKWANFHSYAEFQNIKDSII